MKTRYIKHDDTHFDLEGYIQDEDGNWLWAVIKCYEGNIQLEDDMTKTPAVLVTGADSRGNEFSYWKMYDGVWVDGYNEAQRTPEFIRAHVFPNVTKVYFGDFVMSGREWLHGGCPMDATKEQIEAWKSPDLDSQQVFVIDEYDGLETHRLVPA